MAGEVLPSAPIQSRAWTLPSHRVSFSLAWPGHDLAILGLVVLYLAMKAEIFGDLRLTLLGGIVLVVALAISLAIDVRPEKN
jgi:hypothetical protein